MAGDTMTAPAGASPDQAAAVSLAAWLAAHGPLATPPTLTVVLQVCADASRLDSRELARSLASLDAAHLARDARRQWRWRPERVGLADRRPTDNEVAGRIGALLFECLTAETLVDYMPAETVVRARLRERRPDLSQAVADLTARLASARGGARIALEDVAAEFRTALGARQPGSGLGPRRRWVMGAAAVGLVAATGLWAARGAETGAQLESHGLTADETVLADVTIESADFWTTAGEFILAFTHLEEVERLWRARVAPDDPRLAHLAVRQAWTRFARGDPITAEQYSIAAMVSLERGLGASHPYSRATRLHMGTLLAGRGASGPAEEQHAAARRAARAVLPEAFALALDGSSEPPAPGLLAHASPNAPEREGFRRRGNGSYAAPITSTGRRLAGRDGWRLHIVATGACEAAVDVGRDANRVRASMRRGGDGWRLHVDGVQPIVDVRMDQWTEGRVAVSLDGSPEGTVRVLPHGAEPLTVALDPEAAHPPPHGLAFGGPDGGRECALVWWEVKPEPWAGEPGRRARLASASNSP